MIRIQNTASGAWLDLDSDAEFSIELESPLFEEERLPIAFSTDMSFPLTETNRREFGYHGIALYPPSVKKIPATIFISGLQLISGSLIYSGISDECLNYTFSGKDLDSVLDTKIYKIQGLPKTEGALRNSSLMASIMRGDYDGISAPLLINSNCTDDTCEGGTDQDEVNKDVKYHNNNPGLYFSPAVSIGKILDLSGVLPSGASVFSLAYNLYILGLRKDSNTDINGQLRRGVPDSAGSSSASQLDIAASLPDVSVRDIISGLLKMFCGWFFIDGDGYHIATFSNMADTSGIKDWTLKVSDVHTFSEQKASSYKLRYSSSEDDAIDGKAGDLPVPNHQEFTTYYYGGRPMSHNPITGSVVRRTNESSSDLGATLEARMGEPVGSYADMFSQWSDEDFKQVYHNGTREKFTGRAVFAKSGEEIMDKLCDITYGGAGSYSNAEDKDAETTSCDIPFTLARCIPDFKTMKMAPVINAPDSSERPTEVIIGEIPPSLGYMISRGMGLSDTSPAYDDLAPKALFENYHRDYAAWLAKDRQVISAEVLLRPDEVCAFRLWRPVMIQNRPFLVKSLSIECAASSDSISVTADFISL